MKILDIHCHIFPEKIAEKAVRSIGSYYNAPICGAGTLPDLKIEGKKAGIDRFVIHSTATKIEQVTTINDFISKVQSENPDCIGFGTLHPDFGNIQAEVERVISMGLHGIKLHPDFQGFNIDDEKMRPIYTALEGRLPILMHMGDENSDASSPHRLAKVLDKFPGITVIAAHLGGYRMWDEAMEYLSGRDVYFDTSSSLAFLGKERAVEIIRRHGVHRVLFGTDYPMWSPSEELERFMDLGLTAEERSSILWENSANLLKVR